VSGDETKKAITGPQGIDEMNMDKITAMVPHAQRGVKAPNPIAAPIDTLEC
jgi:hypothetical protein